MNIKKIKYEHYLLNWLKEKKEYVKESTYVNYSNLAFNYVIPILGKYNINSVCNNYIQNYILVLYKKGLSVKTIKDTLVIIKESIKKYLMMELLNHLI